MTPKRKAELRKLAEQRRRIAALYGYDVDIFVVAIPELLDELEACQKQADQSRDEVEAHDREQRLAGARELVHRVPTHTDAYAPEWVSASGMRATLEAMECEARQ